MSIGMNRPQRVAVVGTGLIGGSILLRLQEAGIDVIGWDPDPLTQHFAQQRGIPFSGDLREVVRDRDLVFLGAPLSRLPDSLEEVGKHAPDDCLFTDVGSTKSAIAERAVTAGLADRFVPGHPMSGTEKSGLAAADPALFDGAAWVLCPQPEVPLDRVRVLISFVLEVLHARVVPLRPGFHDSIVALSSHIPHLLAGTLAGAAAESALRPGVLGLAAGSFRDTTRVASTPSARTVDMLVHNRDAILDQVTLVRDFLDGLISALEKNDTEGLLSRFGAARELREDLLARPMNPLTMTFDLVDAHREEREFLLKVGQLGGYVTGCAVSSGAAEYQLLVPKAQAR